MEQKAKRAIVGEIINGNLNMEEVHRFATKGIFVNGNLSWYIYRLFGELKKEPVNYAEKYSDEPCAVGVDTWGVDFGLLDKTENCCPFHTVIV